MITGYYLKVQIGLTVDFKCQVLQWDGVTVFMKEYISFIGRYDITKHDMRKVVMQTS